MSIAAILVPAICAAAVAGGAGYLMGRNGSHGVDPAAPTGGERLPPVARHLLLGRISRGMTHELSQSLNVITMANGNLSYILDGLTISPELKEQISSRVKRIAAHCDTAGRIITQFKWFGQDDNRDKGLVTIGSALDRAIEATKADFRPTGIVIATVGDALETETIHRHGTIEMVVTSLLLAALRALAGRPEQDGTTMTTIELKALQVGDKVEISLSCDAVADIARQPTEGIDSVNLWLAGEIARDRGGVLRISANGLQWFTLSFDYGLL